MSRTILKISLKTPLFLVVKNQDKNRDCKSLHKIHFVPCGDNDPLGAKKSWQTLEACNTIIHIGSMSH